MKSMETFIDENGIVSHVDGLWRDYGDGLHRTGLYYGTKFMINKIVNGETLHGWLSALHALNDGPGVYNRGPKPPMTTHDDPTVLDFLMAWIKQSLRIWSVARYNEWKSRNDWAPTRDQYYGLLFGLAESWHVPGVQLHRDGLKQHIRSNLGIGPDVFGPCFRVYAARCLGMRLPRIVCIASDLIVWWSTLIRAYITRGNETSQRMNSVLEALVAAHHQPTCLSGKILQAIRLDAKRNFKNVQDIFDIYFAPRTAPPLNEIIRPVIKFYLDEDEDPT